MNRQRQSIVLAGLLSIHFAKLQLRDVSLIIYNNNNNNNNNKKTTKGKIIKYPHLSPGRIDSLLEISGLRTDRLPLHE
jgi:hypothetical protein